MATYNYAKEDWVKEIISENLSSFECEKYYGSNDFAPSDNKYFTFTELLENDKIVGYGISGNDLAKDLDTIVIPYEYEGIPVTYIAESGFAGFNNLSIIILPDSINEIRDNAFNGVSENFAIGCFSESYSYDYAIGNNLQTVILFNKGKVAGQINTIKGEIFNNYQSNLAGGVYSHAEGDMTIALGEESHAEGYKTTAVGNYSHSEGYKTITGEYYEDGEPDTDSGVAAHAEGWNTTAIGDASHAEGYGTTAIGKYAHSEGYNAKAHGMYSHAEGNNTAAGRENNTRIQASHAEGRDTIASGSYSHAEGNVTSALGTASHAEGYKTTASGGYSHAEGEGTYATGYDQHVEGSYNIIDSDEMYVHIVGNGSGEDEVNEETGEIITQNRSNAHTLDWEGNAWYQGKVTAEGDITEADNDYVLVNKKFLKEYIDECLSSVITVNAGVENEGKILKVIGGKATWITPAVAEGVEL